MFARQKRSKEVSLLKIINALQKEKIGNYEYLEEIKLDLEERIPLTQKKIEYLKTCIPLLKEEKAKTKIESESKQNLKEDTKTMKQNNQSIKKSMFGRVFSKKRKEADSLQPSTQNPDMMKRDDMLKLTSSAMKDDEPEQNQDNIETKKKSVFFKLFNKEKHDKKISSQKTIQSNDASNNLSKSDDSPNESNTADEISKIETQEKTLDDTVMRTVSQEDSSNIIDEPKKPQHRIKQVLDEINKETEMLRTDIEEARQLNDIKELLREISREKERLKANVEEIKTRFSVKPLVKKYDELEQRLQLSADSLYSIQSNIYERIKEIRILRKELSIIKEDLDSL